LVAEPVGIGFAIANAALFSLYIILGHRVAQSQAVRGIDGLALAMLIAAVVALPIGATGATPAFTDPIALAAGVGVGVSSSGETQVEVGKISEDRPFPPKPTRPVAQSSMLPG
jgi:inner membrane transporter RhtA